MLRTGTCQDKTVFHRKDLELEKIIKVFPNTLCFSFKKLCKHPHGPTGFLLEQMGVDYTKFEFVTTNEGASNVITRVQEKLNAREPHITDGKLNPNFVSIANLDSTSFKQKYLLTEAEYALVKDQCEASNAYFREHLGEEYTDTDIKFSQEDSVVKICTGIIDAYSQGEDATIKLYSGLIDRLENKWRGKGVELKQGREEKKRERERERARKGANGYIAALRRQGKMRITCILWSCILPLSRWGRNHVWCSAEAL